MEKFELQQLRDLPIEGVAERLGLQVSRHKCLCPFHDDSHPSLSFNVRRNTCRCFVCMTDSIGPIDLVMRYLNKNFLDACRWLADENNVIIEKHQPSYISHQPSFDASRYEKFFARPFLNAEARRFLFEERHLDERVVHWCRLTSWRDKQGTPWLQIPYYDHEGKLVGVQNRNLQAPLLSPLKGEDKSPNNILPSHQGEAGRGPRFRFPMGSRCGIYNLPVVNMLHYGEALFIAEGCSDCWSLLSAGHKAIAIPSATLLTRKNVEMLSTLHSGLSTQFHMWPDNDTPGERLFLQLQKVLPNLVRHQLPPGCKDFSELYLIHNS